MKNGRSIIGLILIGFFIIILVAIRNIPIDRRFSLNRTSLQNNVLDDTLFPRRIGDFEQDHVAENINFKEGNTQWKHAQYKDANGRRIDLTIRIVNTDFKSVLDELFLLRCGHIKGSSIFHYDLNFPYRFGECSYEDFHEYNFMWINGEWLISVTAASTMASDIQNLLHFVNSYPY
jgi:hypothetical protein